ncbi:hypothetical protein [Actinoplanes philippinensis]|uniref:hypothetical protein n=1 Tax=Actinoplanes philippinensis TaxID=35752 RepID=UPI0033E41B9A
MLLITYFEDEVELVELADGGEEAFFEGVQLTGRLMDEVVADLEARGHQAMPADIGFSFRAGFSIFSMGSRDARELDPSASEDARVVEGGVDRSGGVFPRASGRRCSRVAATGGGVRNEPGPRTVA